MISPWQLLVLSADTLDELEAASSGLCAELEHAPVPAVAARLRRDVRDARFRRFVVGADGAEVIAALRRPRKAITMTAEVRRDCPPPVAFLFPGAGAQFAGMAADIYAASPLFRDRVDECAALFSEQLGLDVRAAFVQDTDVNDPRMAFTALFTVEYALTEFWRSLGVRPQAVIGHSMGEYTAAVVAGVLSLRDAAALVSVRARLLAGLPAGAMLGVELPEQDVRSIIAETELSIAAINAPLRCVVSGPAGQIDTLERGLAEREVKSRRVRIATAAHSVLVDAVLDEFGQAAAATSPRPPALTYVSNVTGRRLGPDEATDRRYWQRHLRQPVRFAEGLATVIGDGDPPVLLEVGPGTSLADLVRQNEPSAELISSLRHPRSQRTDAASLARATGELWLAGTRIDWAAVEAHAACGSAAASRG